MGEGTGATSGLCPRAPGGSGQPRRRERTKSKLHRNTATEEQKNGESINTKKRSSYKGFTPTLRQFGHEKGGTGTT